MTEQKMELQCTGLCEHCVYIEDGDFICNVHNDGGDVTIVDWKPFPCICTKKRSFKMTEDELKNRISMALKDPVLQQGFEVICKKNMELHLDIKALEEADNINIIHCMKVNGQLLKAKEIIKNLIDSLIAIDGEQVKELKIVKEAEQFLNTKIE